MDFGNGDKRHDPILPELERLVTKIPPTWSEIDNLLACYLIR